MCLLLMKQVKTILSTYSADVFGVCSALFELGGMTVMHDASGCNSTYNTHDEPRWYDFDSMVFISALSEMEAILGDDNKLVEDILDAIQDLHPAFAAIAGTPIPMLVGCDIPTLAAQIEQEADIPCFGFQTNGMNSYLSGVSAALSAYARRMTAPDAKPRPGLVNLLGATPLDFSVNHSIASMEHILSENGWQVLSTWAMGSTPEQLSRAGEAQVNLVISGAGLELARTLQEKFGTPYVIGTPTGARFTARILNALTATARDGFSRTVFADITPEKNSDIVIIGESVMSRSLAAALQFEAGVTPRVVCPLETEAGILSPNDRMAAEEEEIQAALIGAQAVIADPLYRPILPENSVLIPLPHEAFSGRIFRRDIPDLTTIDRTFLKGVLL